MVNNIHLVFKANDRSYFSILKKEIHAIAVSATFDEKKLGEIDIIVAEMVSNLVKHAKGGQVLVKLINESGIPGIEIISMDDGPGMTDVARMMPDGISTKNTLGHGLGAIKRLSDVFQVYSQKSWGTILLSRVFTQSLPLRLKDTSKVEIKAIQLSKPGEKVCGDGFYHSVSNEQLKLFLGDGLGHGPEAAKAVAQAGEAFIRCQEQAPGDILRYIHDAVKKTRGLVGTVAIFDLAAKMWRICGVGNIITKMGNAKTLKSYLPYNGIIGLNLPNTLNAQEINYESGQQLIMTSDGLKTRWDIAKYPAISRYDLSIPAAILLKDFARNTDDMSVIACKINL